jgi:hypothetical protein
VLEKLKSPPWTTPGYRISIRKPGGIGVDHIDSGLTAKQAIALLAQALLTDDPNAA